MVPSFTPTVSDKHLSMSRLSGGDNWCGGKGINVELKLQATDARRTNSIVTEICKVFFVIVY